MTTILSWNVNGLRAALKNGFMEWFSATHPDVLCLQETRVMPNELDAELLAPHGYSSYWNPAQKKGYSGTGIYARVAPRSVETMGLAEFDDEGRVQAADFGDYVVLNGYWPNSQSERKRLDYKLRFCGAIGTMADKLVKKGKNVILCGDFNIAHTPADLARPKENENNAGYYIEEREAMTAFLERGYVDTFRHLNPDKVQYSWWSYRANARPKNIGWRIDYHCVNRAFAPRVKAAWINDEVPGSDHCPVGITLE